MGRVARYQFKKSRTEAVTDGKVKVDRDLAPGEIPADMQKKRKSTASPDDDTPKSFKRLFHRPPPSKPASSFDKTLSKKDISGKPLKIMPNESLREFNERVDMAMQYELPSKTSTRRKDRAKLYKQKQKQKQNSSDNERENHQVKDQVKFGDTVQEPPKLDKARMEKLKKRSLLRQSRNNEMTEQERIQKMKRQQVLDAERQQAIQQYRQMKEQKMK